MHAYAIDLPGHGRSSDPPQTAADSWDSVVAVVRELGPPAPLLVGLAQGSHACLAASLEAPEAIAGVVTLGGSCVRTHENAVDDIAFYTSPKFTELLDTRFFLGCRSRTRREIDTVIDGMIARLGRDWRVAGFKGLRDEVRASFQPAPDGDGWIKLPLPSTISTMLSMKPRDRYFPDHSLYDDIDVPVLIVQLTRTLERAHARQERDLAMEHPLVSVRTLDAGEYPHYTRTEEVAAIILKTCGVTPGPAADGAHRRPRPAEVGRNGGPGRA